MLVIGLTGGIGSGKSTVAQLFAEKGITVIDSDQLARDVTQPGKPALNEIQEHFGSGLINENGSLNRTTLRKIIFGNDNERVWLEQLLHPLIRAEMKKQIEKSTSNYCIVVIPLLFETTPNPLINRILVVDTHEKEQINRVLKRDSSSPEEIQLILKSQVSRAKRLEFADDIIENTGSISELIPQVNRLHHYYSSLA